MMKMKETLDKIITLSQNTIDLPRNGVIERIALLFNLTLANADTANAATVSMEDILKAIEEIRVVADANDIKYALSGLDVGIMNYYDSASKGVKLSDTVSIPAGGTADVSFLLFLDAGEIHALAKEQLDLSVRFNQSVATNVSISDAKVTVTLDKKVFDDANEWIEYYDGVFVEPKVWTKKESFNASTELEEVLNIPVGTIAWRGFITVFDSTGARADIVDKYAIKQTKPRNIELLKVDWKTGKELDKVEYGLDETLSGVTIVDYDQELMPGGFDLRDAEIGTFKLALKASAGGTVRYISHELVIL
ncbi:hypothetical protein [Thermococcus barophilus]|uniref:Uncharacterized protein n=1 Tax=Thermococcus barophilus TaxID=55802 RepID=A0A0S1XF60_THEBA|nr:hypothetical protein [Thermococcus barophilus]ALM76469.1 hypothetical protein TBCH5v1_2580 [Thermococcus barophilus]